MTPEELQADVDSGAIDTVVVAFTDHYGRLMGKRLDASFFLDEALTHGTHACDYLLTVDMEMQPVAGYRYANWDRGYGDFHMVPDLSTMRRAGWAERTAIVLCDLADESTGEPVDVAPRSILRRQLDRLAAHGWTAQAASELEFFLYKVGYRKAARTGFAGLERAGWYIEDYHLLQGARVESYVGAARRALSASEIPVESTKGEAAVGQHEINVRHADVLTMADRHTLMKHGMKELADAMDVSVTFMAKPHAGEAGNSCHIHLSLWDAAGAANVFDDGASGSDLFRWFLGGWMAHLRELMPFFAPTINSYKRFELASWAPTRIAWAHDNRTAGFRIVGHGPSLRIECRIPGADCNPYLAYAATIAAGLDGIEQRIEPPPAYDGDVYHADDVMPVPGSLRDATDGFAASDVAAAAFGAPVVEHYVHHFRSEVASFDAAVTDWERQRYFERI